MPAVREHDLVAIVAAFDPRTRGIVLIVSSPIRHPHRPFDQKPFRLRVGARPLEEADWLEVDGQYQQHVRERLRLLTENHEDVFRALHGTEASGAEVLALVRDHMSTHHPEIALDVHSMSPELHPLDVAGRLVQEDLCLMDREEPGDEYRLVAASLCFPSRWRLADKIGRPLSEIHQPVPHYAEQLNSATNSLFDRLTPERPIWRLNWSLLDDPALYQPTGHSAPSQATPPEQLWLRIERQTLRRLPDTRAVLFTIRIHISPLTDLVDLRDREQLAVALSGLPETMLRYKSMAGFAQEIVAWLRGQSPRSI